MMDRKQVSAGFTLIELVVVIAIIGLLLGALLTPLTTQYQQRKVKEAENGLEDIREALIGFTLANGRLPCPDTDLAAPDGVGNPITGGPCAALVGFLPFQDLGVEPVDTWGRRLIYRVTAEFTYQTQPGTVAVVNDLKLDLLDPGDITINDRDTNKTAITLTNGVFPSDGAAAVVVSLGKNGFSGQDLDNNTLTTVAVGNPGSVDELENVNGDAVFVKRGHSPQATPCSDTAGASAFCEYDDLVIWIPSTIIKSKLVSAYQLP